MPVWLSSFIKSFAKVGARMIKYTCVDCEKEKPVYWAYSFGGRCKECIILHIDFLKNNKYTSNPFLALIETKNEK